MQFEKHSDGNYRALVKDQDGKKALFTTKTHPAEVAGWEDSGLTTQAGYPVMVPKTEIVEVEVDEINIAKKTETKTNEVKVNW